MSLRNHKWRSEAYECGEGNACGIWPAIVGALVSAGIGYMTKDKGGSGGQLQDGAGGLGQGSGFFGPGAGYSTDLLNRAAILGGAGNLAPGDNPLANLGRMNQLGYAQGLLPQLIGPAQEGWLQASTGQVSPHVQDMIDAAQKDLTQDFNRTTMPAIRNRSLATGGFGGSAQGIAEGLAAEGLTEAKGDLQTRMLSNAWNNAQQHQARAWGAMPSMLNAGLMPGQLQEQIGTTEGSLPFQNLQNWQGLVSPWTAYQGSQGSQAGSNPYASILGGAGMGWSLGSQIGDYFGQNNTNPVTGGPQGSYDPRLDTGTGSNYGGGSNWLSGLFGGGGSGGGGSGGGGFSDWSGGMY